MGACAKDCRVAVHSQALHTSMSSAPSAKLNLLNYGNLLAYAFNILTTFLIGQSHLVGKTNQEGKMVPRRNHVLTASLHLSMWAGIDCGCLLLVFDPMDVCPPSQSRRHTLPSSRLRAGLSVFGVSSSFWRAPSQCTSSHPPPGAAPSSRRALGECQLLKSPHACLHPITGVCLGESTAPSYT